MSEHLSLFTTYTEVFNGMYIPQPYGSTKQQQYPTGYFSLYYMFNVIFNFL